MNKLSKFKPVIGMCHQGQRRVGVDEGGMLVYNNIFKDLCQTEPFVVQADAFKTQDGYLSLYGVCRDQHKPLLIGGDHSVSSSSVLASLQNYPDLHVMWIDAHPDINTYKSTVSGNTHGTPLSVCTGLEKTHWASRIDLKMLTFDRLIYVGIRDIDDYEQEIIDQHKVKHFSVDEAI
jgi:arginase family enzyme